MSSHFTRACPLCASANQIVVGPILHPQPTLVAGVVVDLGGQDFSLRRCLDCGFQFKDPVIDPNKLLACYAAADSDNWDESPDPWQRKFDVLLEVLERHTRGRRILDVGCFNGAMLQYFGDNWDRYGIEPSKSAADLARQRGVNVLADTLEGLPDATEAFDVIVASDLVEHLVEPVPFFRQVADRLKPNGIFMLLTGNTDALAWRMLGSMYWYCCLPEHVSFYNRTSLERLGNMLGLECVELFDLRHNRMPSARWLTDTSKSAAYIIGRATRGLGLKPLRRLFLERRGPSVQSAKDHLICVYRKR
jgi:SAM-dependent methyltransferase